MAAIMRDRLAQSVTMATRAADLGKSTYAEMSALRWVRIVAVAVAPADLAVLIVDEQLRVVALRHAPTELDGWLLGVGCA
jgi:roadblock/LC7 domain-containing protein